MTSRVTSLCILLSLSIALETNIPLSVYGKDGSKAKEHKEHKEKKHANKAAIQAYADNPALGLDGSTLSAVNRGQWSVVIEKLSQGASAKSSADKADAWLAFAYMYLYKCDDLKSLAAAKTGDSVYATLIQSYSQMCQSKFDDADRTLKPLADDKYKDDPVVQFALAAIAGKQGRVQSAVDYCQRAVSIAPKFAWGYRTIGLLEQRFLKDMVKADAAFSQSLAIEPNAVEAVDALVDIKLSRNDFDGASDVAAEALAHDDNAIGHYRVAQILIQQWRLREALIQLEQAIELSPQDARFYRSRSSIKRYQGDMKAAIADQKKAVEYGNDKSFEWGELAAMDVLAGNKDEAVNDLREAIKINPKNNQLRGRLVALLRELKRNDDLIALYKEQLSINPKDARLHSGLAQALLNSGKKEDAIQEFMQAAELDQTDPEPHRQIALIRIEEGNWDAAHKEYTRVLSINPTSVVDLVALGFCYAQDGDYEPAKAAFVTSLALQKLMPVNPANPGPTQLQINRSLGELLLAQGNYSDAAVQFEAICAATKNTPEAQGDNFLLLRAKALRDRSKAASEAMIAAYKALPAEQQSKNKAAVVQSLLDAGKLKLAIEFAGGLNATGDRRLDIELAQAARLTGDATKAHDLVSSVVSLPDLPSRTLSAAQEELAQQAYDKGDNAKAEEYAKKAVDASTKNYRAYETLGRLALAKGDMHVAVDNANKAYNTNPAYAGSFILMGDAETKSGKLKDAASSYRRATELYPAWLEAHKALLTALQKLPNKDEATKEAEQIKAIEKQQI